MFIIFTKKNNSNWARLFEIETFFAFFRRFLLNFVSQYCNLCFWQHLLACTLAQSDTTSTKNTEIY